MAVQHLATSQHPPSGILMASTASVRPGQGWASDCGWASRAPLLGLSVPSEGGAGGMAGECSQLQHPDKRLEMFLLPHPEVLQLPVPSGNKA